MRRGPAAPAVTAVLLLALVGCSDDGGDEPAAAPSTSGSPTASSGSTARPDGSPSPSTTDIAELVAGLPGCAEVWVAGETLPADYAGCKEPGGGIDPGMVLQCVDGAGLAAYRDRFWARLDGEISDSGGGGIAQDPEYAADVTACQG